MSSHWVGNMKEMSDEAIWDTASLFNCARYITHDAFLFYLLCKQLPDFPCLEPEPQQLQFQSNAAFLPIHTGCSNSAWRAALHNIGHGEDSELCFWTRTRLKDTKHTSTYNLVPGFAGLTWL